MNSPQQRRRAFVSGGTRGIGRAVAERLAAGGTEVFLCARDEEGVAKTVKEMANAGAVVDGIACDVTDAADVDAAVQAANAAGPVNIVVNNAGRGGGGPTAEISDELWDAVITTNLTSVFRVTRGFLAAGLKDAGWGRIINVASTAGKQGVVLGAPYSASKHGVVGFTKALGLELAKSGVTVNAVCPGYVETPMAMGIRQGYADFWGITEGEVRARFEAKIPLGRYTTPEEVAGLVGYLTEPAADAITAQAINVCGGLGNF
jgi:ketoreductase